MHYKATRPDATSFHDAVTRWEVGEVTSLPKGTQRGSKLCGPNLLHAATVPAESLVGGSWPCRLFAVEPKAKLLTDPRHPHKVGCRSWLVVEELPAAQVFGPNGEAVVALIERCKTLTTDEAKRLNAAWDAAWGAAWDAARGAARGAALVAARGAALVAARDAAWAVVTWDLATPDGPYTIAQRDLSIGPWREVCGLPETLAPR